MDGTQQLRSGHDIVLRSAHALCGNGSSSKCSGVATCGAPTLPPALDVFLDLLVDEDSDDSGNEACSNHDLFRAELARDIQQQQRSGSDEDQERSSVMALVSTRLSLEVAKATCALEARIGSDMDVVVGGETAATSDSQPSTAMIVDVAVRTTLGTRRCVDDSDPHKTAAPLPTNVSDRERARDLLHSDNILEGACDLEGHSSGSSIDDVEDEDDGLPQPLAAEALQHEMLMGAEWANPMEKDMVGPFPGGADEAHKVFQDHLGAISEDAAARELKYKRFASEFFS